jgi:hypothetical protein
MVKAEKVQALPTFCQVHDPRLGVLELKAKLGQDRRERGERPFGLLPGLTQGQQIIRLCRVTRYAERGRGSPVVAGVGW